MNTEKTKAELIQEILTTFRQLEKEAAEFLSDTRNGQGEFVVKTKLEDNHVMRSRAQGWDFAGHPSDTQAFIIRKGDNVSTMRKRSGDERIQVAQPRRSAVEQCLASTRSYIQGMEEQLKTAA